MLGCWRFGQPEKNSKFFCCGYGWGLTKPWKENIHKKETNDKPCYNFKNFGNCRFHNKCNICIFYNYVVITLNDIHFVDINVQEKFQNCTSSQDQLMSENEKVYDLIWVNNVKEKHASKCSV